ncbi:MAG: YqhA family protein [Roseiflexus sp.]|nr:YqhA family protein [Roseiflexus sp.]MCS7288795.1 YqhA family protein [Roseiflexus sp.]MDW8147341.1 YqhA family protein [Roseiflexaceae bacterium]MDW8233232.1 YqhA family protein [Roseiflexaceae bacterium]
MTRLIGLVRYIIIVAVLVTLIAATALILFGTVETFVVIRDVFAKGEFTSKVAKTLLLSFIEITDIFLLATVLYIVALGLYELFIDDRVPVPRWLEIHTLDDLKDKLVGVIIVVIGVGFLGQFTSWNGETNLLISGGGAALVIAALTFFLSQKGKKEKERDKDQTE